MLAFSGPANQVSQSAHWFVIQPNLLRTLERAGTGKADAWVAFLEDVYTSRGDAAISYGADAVDEALVCFTCEQKPTGHILQSRLSDLVNLHFRTVERAGVKCWLGSSRVLLHLTSKKLIAWTHV